jgi:hypothetical protein
MINDEHMHFQRSFSSVNNFSIDSCAPQGDEGYLELFCTRIFTEELLTERNLNIVS